MRWPVNLGELRPKEGEAPPAAGAIDPQRRILAMQPLAELLDTVSSPPPGAEDLVEHVIAPTAAQPAAVEER